ncbi:peptidoglycan-associated lipoprotein Pal [Mariprofundus sp. EBB-1]|uniref:peptidoglycan-associated lipoprotein Pal n=1 Tax=Mariprofundus sp. EBB-1 TaxID=2650971 RepID=UPI000EF1DFB9|nr:peptidoglycan-associated lipoprotein Pal [Mariprofundus sp. EBB-1]RLL55575.1 peptidoglycan-associated lipoprotein Pal [Mariprofundus sp. EBB-1]
MFTNRSKSKTVMIALAAATMLFAGCNKHVVESTDSNTNATPTHSSTTSTPSTHGVSTSSDAAKPSATAVHFAFDSAALDGAAQATLEAYAAWLNANSSTKITIEGNCDQRGSREYNLALGQQRADSVRDYLTARGVNASNVDTVSFGEERPACSGSGNACWAQNRRGDIVIR